MLTLFYREWRVFALAIGIIVVTGLTAINTIGRQEDPTLTNLFTTITTPFPGASPARVESLVTEKIEEELKKISEIEEIRSISREGISIVIVELSELISDEEIDASWSEIRDALSDASRNFPAGVPEPEFDNDKFGAYTAISVLSPRDGGYVEPSQLQRYAELLRDQLRQLPGARIVRLFGEQEEEVLVTVDARHLTDLGLTPAMVTNAIRQADSKVRAGQLRGDENNYLLEVKGEIKSVERIRQVPLVTQPNGTVVRVGDVASIERGTRWPVSSIGLTSGKPAILVGATMEEGLQVDAWVKALRAETAEFEQTLPDDIVHSVLFDQSQYTIDRLGGLTVNILIGSSLVIIVLFFTLGWRGAFIVACILPLTTLLSVTVLQYAGVPIHQMSVTGLIVALGLLVDAAIVMTDDIRRRLIGGVPRLQSVEQAVRRLAGPLLASTVTTVLAFMPMALLPGPAGDFVGSIAIAVIVMLVASFLLALTVTPALAGWLLPAKGEGKSHAWYARGMKSGKVGQVFDRSVGWAISNRGVALFAALALPIIGLLAFPTLTSQFFPGVERDQFHIQMQLDSNASIVETQAMTDRAEAIIKSRPEITSVTWVVGESAPSFYYNMLSNQDSVAAFAEALITTVSEEATREVIPVLQELLDREIPEAQTLVKGLYQGPPVNAPVEILVTGPDVEVLREVGEQIRERMSRAPYVEHTRATFMGGSPKLVFTPNEDKVNLAGLTLGDVSAHLDAALEGVSGGSLLEDTEELPVRVRYDDDWRESLDRIRSIDIPVPSNGEDRYRAVPLTALGEISVEPSESPINRENGERTNTVQAFTVNGVLPQVALEAVQAQLALDPVVVPTGYRLSVGGDSDERAGTVNNLMAPIGLIVVLTIATIVLTFNRFKLSMITGVVAILSMCMSLLALEIFNYPFGIQALIGVIGSIGVSINAAIIILTALQQDERAMAGDLDRIREIVIESSRHIISTTTTTFGGFLPLIIEGGGFWPPFAMAIAGGVLLSTIISLYFTPIAFTMSVAGRHEASMPELKAVAAQ